MKETQLLISEDGWGYLGTHYFSHVDPDVYQVLGVPEGSPVDVSLSPDDAFLYAICDEVLYYDVRELI